MQRYAKLHVNARGYFLTVVSVSFIVFRVCTRPGASFPVPSIALRLG